MSVKCEQPLDELKVQVCLLYMTTQFFKYCKRGDFRGGGGGGDFRVFRTFVFYAKITPMRKYNPHAFMKEIVVVSWKLPPRELSCQHFREIIP